jgi:hypothetical protein
MAITVMINPPRIEEIVASGENDVTHVQCQRLVGLFEIDRAGGTKLLARFAFAVLEIGAVVVIDDGILGHGLRERAIDGFAIT